MLVILLWLTALQADLLQIEAPSPQPVGPMILIYEVTERQRWEV